jgi:4-hydroxy-tetrahydrodipicolinate reductase
MNLALIGYGRMGRLIEQLAPAAGMRVALVLDIADNPRGEAITAERFAGIDVAIEFTQPDAAADNLLRLAALRIPTVCGTTGWFARLPEVTATVDRHGAALVWSANFSVGVNVFFRLAAEAARWMAAQPGYEAWAWEIHHSAKKDAPSGTLLQALERMKQAGFDAPVSVASNRAGAHPGTHEIGFDSPADSLTLRHTARSREGFARGVLYAAKKIHGRRGVVEFSQILFEGQES